MIQATSSDVVFIEEINKILKTHILTFLRSHMKQLIMIEDYKQLWFKCSYEFSMKQNDDFDFNRFFFEQLICKDFLHIILTQQHWMKLKIFSIIHHFIYFDFTDADSILQHVDLQSFCNNVIFINHSHLKMKLKNERKLNDDRTFFKQNEFKDQMILKCVQYLTQQKYESDIFIIIMSYFNQLKLLKN